jgi:hypothetical protein
MDNSLTELEEQNIDPRELQATLMGFLGQTYQEISKYDNNIVSPNAFLAPKKQEFQRTAETIMREAIQSTTGANPNNRPTVYPNNVPRQIQPQQPQPSNQPFLETGKFVPPPVNDPNQLEFTFDNSVTAITINNKLEDIEKKLKKLDNLLQKVIQFVESKETVHEPKNKK